MYFVTDLLKSPGTCITGSFLGAGGHKYFAYLGIAFQ